MFFFVPWHHNIEKIVAKFNAIKGRLGKTNPAAYKMIESRITYLQTMLKESKNNKIDLSQEYQSVHDVDNLGKGKETEGPQNQYQNNMTPEELEQLQEMQNQANEMQQMGGA